MNGTRDALVEIIFKAHGCSCDRHGSNGVADNCLAWRKRSAERVADSIIAAERTRA